MCRFFLFCIARQASLRQSGDLLCGFGPQGPRYIHPQYVSMSMSATEIEERVRVRVRMRVRVRVRVRALRCRARCGTR